MKSRAIKRLCLLSSIFSLTTATLSAQTVGPSNPSQFTKRNLGENGGSGSSTGVSGGGATATTRTVVIQYVAVTPAQAWVNSDGKTMEARLLAFSAPEPGQTGPVEIIREGKVRFLVKGRKDPIDYPLDQLGETEQARIKALAEVAAKGPPAAQKPE